nr:beta-1,3-galactosyltransferase 5-like [Procambarus clarkii]
MKVMQLLLRASLGASLVYYVCTFPSPSYQRPFSHSHRHEAADGEVPLGHHAHKSDTVTGDNKGTNVFSSYARAGDESTGHDEEDRDVKNNYADGIVIYSEVKREGGWTQETATPSDDHVSTAAADHVGQNDTWPHTTHPSHALEPPEFIPDLPDSSPAGQPASIPKRFLIEEADYCQKRPDFQVIAYVHSAITNVKNRRDVRVTWGNASNYDLGDVTVKVGVVFMVGRAKNALERHIVQVESHRYHDIVQGDYGDHYRLLSYKGLASLYWINKHCSHVPWTLHADDDTHIDIFLYYRALQELDDVNEKQFICSHMYGPALREGRWKVRYKEYPSQDYPLYCSGGAWFLQTNLIPRLLEASKVVPFLWVDDAYITGLLARQAGIEQLGFQDYYGGAEVDKGVLGHQVVWFEKFAPRSVWWKEIVNYHKKYSLHDPATLIPK